MKKGPEPAPAAEPQQVVRVRDLLSRYSVDALRLYLLGHHYRSVVEWAPYELEAAAGLADRLSLGAREPDQGGPSVRDAFRAALEDDLNTPRAIETLEQAAGQTLRELGGVLGLQFTA